MLKPESIDVLIAKLARCAAVADNAVLMHHDDPIKQAFFQGHAKAFRCAVADVVDYTRLMSAVKRSCEQCASSMQTSNGSPCVMFNSDSLPIEWSDPEMMSPSTGS